MSGAHLCCRSAFDAGSLAALHGITTLGLLDLRLTQWGGRTFWTPAHHKLWRPVVDLKNHLPTLEVSATYVEVRASSTVGCGTLPTAVAGAASSVAYVMLTAAVHTELIDRCAAPPLCSAAVSVRGNDHIASVPHTEQM